MSKSEVNYTSTKIPTDSLPTYSPDQHAYITLTYSDRLRLFRFPPTIIDVVRQTAIASWPPGLQSQMQNGEFYDLKFHGNPWWGEGDEAVPSKFMMLHVLSALHSHGWHLLAANDICRLSHDRNSLIFQFGVTPPPTSFFAISRYQLDKLRLICAPPELVEAVRQIFGQANIQHEEWRDGGVCYQLKLRGKMWTSDETVSSRMKLIGLLDCFASFGWQLHVGLYMNGTAENNEADTWFFRQKIQ